jgi:putative ABC transport system permease protein
MKGSAPKPPVVGRLLARLILGPDADVLRGDLEEGFHVRVREHGNSIHTRVRHVADVALSLVVWWKSGAFRRSAEQRHPQAWGGGMRGIGTELRQIWRGLRKRPAYAAVVVLTLGVGIGATTTIYSVVDAMMIQPMPYADAERLMVIGNTIPGQEWVGAREGLQRIEPMSAPNALDLVERAKSVERAALIERSGWITARADGPAEVIQIAAVSEGFFDILSTRPVVGRTPLREDRIVFGSAPNVLLSHGVWQRRFGGDGNVVGKLGDRNIVGKLADMGEAYRVIGVLPRDFEQPAALVGSDVDIWIALDPSEPRYSARARRNVRVIAKLAPGVSVDRARAELSAAQSALARDERAGNVLPDGKPLGIGMNSLRDETVGSAGRPVLVFLGAALLLLLLAGANAANLLLVRGLEREGDLALRRALGAGRFRLVYYLLAESVSLAVAGGVLGLAIAIAGVSALHRYGPISLPRMAEIAVNPRIALAGVLLSILVGVSIGIVPALRSGGVDLLANLRSSINASASKGTRMRTALSAAQLALALVLGIGASLLFRSFVEITTYDLGFKPERLTAFHVPLKGPSEEWDRLTDAVRAIPGVTAVGAASHLPFQTPGFRPIVQRADQSVESPSAGVPHYAVTPDFFTTAGIRLIEGRYFNESDRPGSPLVAIVNQAFARTLFADRDPIGARVRILSGNGPAVEREVVGVVADVVQARVEDGMTPALYVPHTQGWGGLPNVLIASDRDPVSLGEDLALAISRATRLLPVLELSTMSSRITVTRAGPRFQMLLITVFAICALLLSAIGLYGTLAFTVRSRTRELGIRMAIGAGQAAIYKLVMRQGFAVLVVGVAAGLAGAFALTRLLQGFLFGVKPIDPAAFLLAIVVVASAVLLAALRPARRAASIDPMSSIRLDG